MRIRLVFRAPFRGPCVLELDKSWGDANRIARIAVDDACRHYQAQWPGFSKRELLLVGWNET